MPTFHKLRRFLQHGPLYTSIRTASNAWSGRSLVASGTATLSIPTTVVNSDSLIFLSPQGTANVSSGQPRGFEVKSINPDVGFVMGTPDGAAVARDTTIMWNIFKTSQ
jgi:hypothetical protein